MTIKELISKLEKLPNQNREITIVAGNEDCTLIDTTDIEIHHAECLEHPAELFVFYVDNC